MTKKTIAITVIFLTILTGLVAWRHTPFSGLYFGIGAVLGVVSLWLDEHYFYRFYTQVNAGVSPQLITRSVLFLLVLVPLSIFVVSSTGNAIGQGLAISLVVTLAVELLLLRTNVPVFNARFASQSQTPFTSPEIIWACLVYALLSGVMAGIVLL